VTVSLPPLRERPGDVALLARHFLEDLSRQAGKHFDLTDATLAKLQRLPWHGNVRELRNFIERSVWLSEGRELQVTGLIDGQPGHAEPAPASPDTGQPAGAAPQVDLLLPYKVSKQRWNDHFDLTYLPALIGRCDGNVSKAAREAGLDRAYLFRLLRRHGLKE
jgi:DNA-binding NtrC family response regulator